MAKVIKEISSDLNIFLAGGLFRGEHSLEGQGRRLEGNYLTFHIHIFVLGPLIGSAVSSSGQREQHVRHMGWRVFPNGLLTLTRTPLKIQSP